MAKRAAEPKPANPQAEDRFVELMLVAADFVKNCGGLSEAKKALADAGQFIKQAGGVSNAEKALGVLESLKDKIGA
jgi:deoxyribose-phosphate aldolase